MAKRTMRQIEHGEWDNNGAVEEFGRTGYSDDNLQRGKIAERSNGIVPKYEAGAEGQMQNSDKKVHRIENQFTPKR